MNEVLLVVVIVMVTGGLAVANYPPAAKWLATVLFARALAVEAGRETFRKARERGLRLEEIVHLEAPRPLVMAPRDRA
jgi:hypothetical protein